MQKQKQKRKEKQRSWTKIMHKYRITKCLLIPTPNTKVGQLQNSSDQQKCY